MASSSTSSSKSHLIQQFVGMGFSKKMAVKAIKDTGEDNSEAILETVLTFSPMIEEFLRGKKRKLHIDGRQDSRRCTRIEKQLNVDDDKLHLPNPFGLPKKSWGLFIENFRWQWLALPTLEC